MFCHLSQKCLCAFSVHHSMINMCYYCLDNPTAEETGGLYSPWDHKDLEMTEVTQYAKIYFTLFCAMPIFEMK